MPRVTQRSSNLEICATLAINRNIWFNYWQEGALPEIWSDTAERINPLGA